MFRLTLVITVLAVLSTPAAAVQMVQNGDFETGNFDGWVVTDRYIYGYPTVYSAPATLYSSGQCLNDYPLADTYDGGFSLGWYRTDGDFNSAVPGGEGPGAGSVAQTWTVSPGTYSVKVGAAVFTHHDRLTQIEDYWGAGIQIKIYVDGQTDPVWQHDFWAGEGDSFWRHYSECTNQVSEGAENRITTLNGSVKFEVVWRTKWDADMDLCCVDDVQCDLVLNGAPPAGTTVFTPKDPPTWSAPLSDWNPVKKTFHWPLQGVASGGDQFHQGKEYKVGMHPSCSAAGDFNSDGLMDLAVANEWSHTVSVLLGTGNNSFQPAVDYPAGLNPTCVQAVQLVGDDALDLVVSCRGSSEFLVFPGNGNGTFGSPTSVPTGKGTAWLTVGDFNGDSINDVAVVELPTDSMSVFLGNGTGGFVQSYHASTGDMPDFITCADINKDGNLDLAIGEFFGGVTEIWQGYGDGTFLHLTDLDSRWQCVACAIDDYDEDGNPDVCTLSTFDSIGLFYLQYPPQGDFFFYPYTENGEQVGLRFRFQPMSLASFDANNDGHPDLAACTHNSCGTTIYESGGAGPGSYNLLGRFGSGDSPRHVLAVDMNRDNYADMVVCSAQSQTISVIDGGPNNIFDAPHLQSLDGWFPQSCGVALADLDNDGDKDAIVGGMSNLAYQVFVLENNGTLDFEQKFSTPEGELLLPILACSAADFNGDGWQDIVALDYYKAWVLLGTGSFGFQPPVAYPMGNMLQDVQAVDINNDGKQDIVSVDTGSYTERVVVRLGDGAGGFAPNIVTSIGKTGPKGFAIGDFNGDGKKDVVIALYNTSQFVIMTGKGDGSFNPAVSYPAGSGASGIAVGDFNNDSKLDVAVLNTTAGTVSIVLGDGGGGFGAKTDIAVGVTPVDICSADFDLDGNADIVTTNQGDYTLTLLKGNGDGLFQSPQTYRTSGRPERLAAADLRGIGVPDVLITCSRNYSPEIFANSLLPTGAPAVSDEGDFQVAADHISGSWLAVEHLGRPIVEYRWAVSTTTSPNDIIPGGEWQSVGAATTATRSAALTQGGKYYILAQALDSANLWSPIGASDGITVGAPSVPTAAAAKLLADGSPLALTDKVVSRVWPGTDWYCYVQEPDRSSGIRVRPSPSMSAEPAPAVGSVVDAAGTVTTEAFERVIEIAAPLSPTAGIAPLPLGMTGRELGGSGFGGQSGVIGGTGLSNVGLLVRVCGWVTRSETGEDCFYVDDGSGLSDGVGLGLRCVATGLTKPAVGTFVNVDGVSGVTDLGGNPIRCVRVSRQEDIR